MLRTYQCNDCIGDLSNSIYVAIDCRHRPLIRARDTDKIEQRKLIGRETVGALFVSDNKKLFVLFRYNHWFTPGSSYVFKRIS